MQPFQAETGIELDSIYTAKSLMKLQSVLSLPSAQRPLSLRKESRILFMHTGGIQGNRFRQFSKDKNASSSPET
jgi:1-aminocyclopropane-1-carboxylate deaminase/D-cysteine desulfhydrase-like pyridoxal-dependent ACC family enzyme